MSPDPAAPAAAVLGAGPAATTSPRCRARRWRTRAVLLVGALGALAAAAGLARLLDGPALAGALARAAGDPGGLVLAVGAFAAAFALRAWAWVRVLPGLPPGQALAALHVSLGANHVLPLRLGEPLRVVSAVRRAGVSPVEATATTVLLRSADVVSLLLLGLVVGPATVRQLLGPWGAAAAAALVAVGVAALVVVARQQAGGLVRLPGPTVVATVFAAWVCEAVVVWQVARWFELELAPTTAVLVLAAAISAQLVAVAPGGLGTYEAAAALALSTTTGTTFAAGMTVAFGIHGFKTLYSVTTGLVATVVPDPGLLGRLRLPRRSPWRRPQPAPAGPVVLFLPAHDEGPRVAEVVARAPRTVGGRPVEVVVVDDGSTDDTADRAAAAGARVVRHRTNRGLGAAVRTGLAEAVAAGAAAVAFCDADGEYDPADLEDLVAPVLDGRADYVVGSRFSGRIDHMRPHRRLGNKLLTAWVRWLVRRPVTDGQSGYRALSRAAAAEVALAHDYNYAQVLTVELAQRGFGYLEVPIRYTFRSSGRSFIRLLPYLRAVVPAVWRQLNPATPPNRRTEEVT